MASIDLDQLRAARREGKSEGITVALGGEEFTLPPEIPFAVVEGASRIGEKSTLAEVSHVLIALLGEEQWGRFMKHQPSFEDVTALFQGAMTEYGLSPGESSASEATSKSTSRRSKPTSKDSTGSR